MKFKHLLYMDAIDRDIRYHNLEEGDEIPVSEIVRSPYWKVWSWDHYTKRETYVGVGLADGFAVDVYPTSRKPQIYRINKEDPDFKGFFED